MSLKNYMMRIDVEDQIKLNELSFKLSLKENKRVSISEIVRRSIKEFLEKEKIKEGKQE